MTSEERGKVERFRSGDRAAFEEIYAEHADVVYRTCYGLSGRAADAEDLTSETFLAAHGAKERFKGTASLKTWLLRIAYRRWRALKDRASSREVSIQDREIGCEGTGTDSLDLQRALEALSPDLKVAFLLVKAEGLKYREAAEVLGVPQGTVQYRVHEASQRLRRSLAPEPLPRLERCGNEV